MNQVQNIPSYYESNPKVQKYFKEGRGQKLGQNYIPWLKTHTHEFSSKGRATRILGVKTGRIHHLQSDNQYRAFLLFEFNEAVSDIREAYPLLDVMEVIDNSEDLRFDKFCDKETKQPYVITTNFLLTLKDEYGSRKYVARTVKNVSELSRKITWEKLEIERRYWQAKNIDWKVITNKQLPRQLAKNIEWVRETLLPGSGMDEEKETLSVGLLRYLLENTELSLKEVLKVFEKHEGIAKGTALFLFRYLIATKELRIDMAKNIDFSSKVSDLVIYGGIHE